MTPVAESGAFRGVAALVVGLLVAVAPPPALADASPWWRSEHASVRLIADGAANGDGRTITAGLQFRMAPGWKIYWRSPGDAGFPPRPDWAGSRNLAAAELAWPAPERFSILGLESMGYEGEVVLPLTVVPERPGEPVSLAARVPFLTCAEVCVPYTATVVLDLPAGPAMTTPEAGLIAEYAARVPPRQGEGAPLEIRDAAVAGPPGRQDLVLTVAAVEGGPLRRPDVFVEGPPRYAWSAPQTAIAGDGRTAVLRVAVTPPKDPGAGLAGRQVTLTVVDGQRAVERSLPLGVAIGAEPAADGRSLLAILALALLGGLILNLMPCVLPVLSIKLLAVVGHGGGEARHVRRGFLAASAGILASFLVLGTLAVGLREAGLAAGWGIQFQQPLFLAAMVVVLTLFAANLWGLYEFRLPGGVADAAARAGAAPGMAGHFLTGALATLLATPCSAPFLGTAVGFALAHGPARIYAVFAALGIGLAAPYLLVAALPRLVVRLPRPGRWMVMLRRVLAVALLGTALWLLAVLAGQIGAAMTTMVAALMAAALVALWQLSSLDGRARAMTWAVVGALGFLSLFAAATPGPDARARGVASGSWVPFDRAAITGYVADGRTVLVDVTADWCLTCKVNKAVALDDAAVRARLAGSEVVAMQADWTRPDPVIAGFLRDFGRYGIPFNVVFGPAAPKGIALPELLTARAVLGALDRARGGAALAGR